MYLSCYPSLSSLRIKLLKFIVIHCKFILCEFSFCIMYVEYERKVCPQGLLIIAVSLLYIEKIAGGALGIVHSMHAPNYI